MRLKQTSSLVAVKTSNSCNGITFKSTSTSLLADREFLRGLFVDPTEAEEEDLNLCLIEEAIVDF
jgi:hypothetical protein